MYKKLPAFIDNLTTEAALVMRFDLAQLAANTGNLNAAHLRLGLVPPRSTTRPARRRRRASRPSSSRSTPIASASATSTTCRGAAPPRRSTSRSSRASRAPRRASRSSTTTRSSTSSAASRRRPSSSPSRCSRPAARTTSRPCASARPTTASSRGAGVDPLDNLRLDVGGGYFQQGKFDLEDVRGKNVYTYGGSGRIVFHQGMPVPQSVDFLLYRNDPNKPLILFKPEKYDPNQLGVQPQRRARLAPAAPQGLRRRGRARRTRRRAARPSRASSRRATSASARRASTAISTSSSATSPASSRSRRLPNSAKTDPELFGSVGADYHFPGAAPHARHRRRASSSRRRSAASSPTAASPRSA